MTSPGRRFLVLHGWQNRRPAHHWQWQLVESLRAAGEQVLYPQFPDPDRPVVGTWTELLRAELAQLGAGERVVVAHSLAVPLWQHAASLLTPAERVDRVLLVAPPAPEVLAGYPEVAAFAAFGPDAHQLSRGAGSVRLVASDDDPYWPGGGAVPVYRALGVDVDLLPGQGHLDPEAGYGRWPAVEAWCRDPSTRLARADPPRRAGHGPPRPGGGGRAASDARHESCRDDDRAGEAVVQRPPPRIAPGHAEAEQRQ
ncbi:MULTISPECIES: RBBP9/YdeN family alpha/beta hydrolase [unclassified Blastococcus]